MCLRVYDDVRNVSGAGHVPVPSVSTLRGATRFTRRRYGGRQSCVCVLHSPERRKQQHFCCLLKITRRKLGFDMRLQLSTSLRRVEKKGVSNKRLKLFSTILFRSSAVWWVRQVQEIIYRSSGS
jgi:hypothetical protein